MKLIKQPAKSKICGQCGIAMVADISIEESIKLYGHSHSTNMSEHIKILGKLGIKTNKIIKVDNRKKYHLPSLSLVRLQKVGRQMGHLVVHKDGKFYDPSRGVFESKEALLSSYNMGRGRWRIDLYIEVLKERESEMEAV